MRIEVRSRPGNAVLGVLGVFYLIFAAALFAYDLVQTWGAASTMDRVVQAALIVSAIAGVMFIVIALRNFGLLRASHHAAQLHREGAAAAR
jgi:hypothetical protein